MPAKMNKIFQFWYFKTTFSRQFNLYTSEDEKELDEIFRIRYQTYCEEYGYLDKKLYTDKREFDEYDKCSAHFILRTKKDELAASLRLILPTRLGFPIEKHFRFNIDTASLPHTKAVEISRLIVAKRFRRRFLLLAMVKGIFAFTRANDITHAYSVLDEKLFPVLKNMGFPFKQIGPPTLYQGITRPYILDVAEMTETLMNNNPRLYRYLMNGYLGYDVLGNNYSIH